MSLKINRQTNLEKLFDEFGDVVLENNEQDQPQVITDYVDDLKDMFLKG